MYIDCETGDRYQNPSFVFLKRYTGKGSIFKNNTGLYMYGKFLNGEFKQGILLYLLTILNYIGTMILNGNRNEGLFETNENKQSYLQGFGKIFFANGDFHIGRFKDGKLNGYGKVIYKNGCIYKGQFRDNVLNGNGKIKLRDGVATIKGKFNDGLLHGKGLYNISIYINLGMYKSTRKKIVGDFVNGVLDSMLI